MAAHVELVNRPLLEGWQRGSVSWSLHLNDLGNFDKAPVSVIADELKLLALFDDITLIRDADVVNSLQIMELFGRDGRDIQGFRSAIRAGVFAFPIRSDADSFWHVNDTAKGNRAHSERYAPMHEFLPEFDQFLADWQVTTPTIVRDISSDTFAKLIENRVLPFLATQGIPTELLAISLETAKEDAARLQEPVRFGHIFNLLDDRANADRAQVQELIQWCRMAHVLAVPSELSLASSSADHDADPVKVAVILGHKLQGSDYRRGQWFERYPKLIPDRPWIAGLGFDEIVRLRDLGFKAGYFASLARLQGVSQKDQSFDSLYEDYLLSLSAYLKALQWQTKAKFYDWQTIFAEDLLKVREKLESFWFRTPILVSILGASYTLAHHSPTPAVGLLGALGSLGIGSLVHETVKYGHEYHRIRHPDPIAELLRRGTTRTPAAGLSDSNLEQAKR